MVSTSLLSEHAWSPGELKKAVATAYDSSSPAILDRAGRRFLRNQEYGEQQIDLKIITGWDPVNGLYMPGPDGSDGHFWVGDTIDLTTGMDNSTILDYQSEPQAVTGIQLRARRGSQRRHRPAGCSLIRMSLSTE